MDVLVLRSLLLAVTLSVVVSQSSEGRYIAKLVKANNAVALTALKEASILTGYGNVVLSPHSIMTSVGMLSTGAKGETRQEIRDAMQLSRLSNKKVARGLSQLTVSTSESDDGNETANYTLSVANRMWVQQSMKLCKRFQRVLTNYSSAKLSQLDFQQSPELSRQLINEWVENQTNDKIRDLLPTGSISPLTRLVLANAVYFQGYWESKFSSKNTESRPFQTCNASGSPSTVSVDMMHQRGPFMVGSDSDARIIELPYAGKHVSMYVLLPVDTSCSGLTKLENSLSAKRLSRLMSGMTGMNLDLYLPRFDLSYDAPLKDVLMKMGVKKVFGDADLSGIDCKNNSLLHVSGAFHKAAVQVDEEGTTAAAATAIVIRVRSHFVRDFNVNRQFLFVIKDNRSKAVLFIGRVVNPLG